MQFKDVIGHQSLKHHLIQSTLNGRISHAQLFLGPLGNGALALALAYAQFVNCTNQQTDDSCGICAACIKAHKMIHPDIHYAYPTVGPKAKSTDFAAEWRKAILENPYLNSFEWLQFIEAENRQGNMTAEECEEIIRKLAFKPFEGKYKVIIIWLPEYLAKEGNRLLKLIEEPPANTLFILVANQAEKILTTIRSRTQLLNVARYPDKIIEQAIIEKQGVATKQAAQVAVLAEGNYNRALKIVQGKQQVDVVLFVKWMHSIVERLIPPNVLINEEIATIGRESQKNFLKYTLHFLRQSLNKRLLPNKPTGLSQEEEQLAMQFVDCMGVETFGKIAALLEQAIYHVERNANPKILFLNLSIQLIDYLAIEKQTLQKKA